MKKLSKVFLRSFITLTLSTILVFSNYVKIWATTAYFDVESTHVGIEDPDYHAYIGAYFYAQFWRGDGLNNEGGKFIISYQATSRYMARNLWDFAEIYSAFNVHSSGGRMSVSVSGGNKGGTISCTNNPSHNDATFTLHKNRDWEAYADEKNTVIYNIYTWDHVDITLTTTVFNNRGDKYCVTNGVDPRKTKKTVYN